VLKGCSSVWLGGFLGSLLAPSADPLNMRGLAALCAVLGHVFTVWLNFKGGKGVATGFGVFLVAAPWAALAAISLFALILALSRYVSLASILGAASFPFFAWLFNRLQGNADRPPFFVAVEIAVAAVIVLKHHQNIRRLFNGAESRIGSHSAVRKTA